MIRKLVATALVLGGLALVGPVAPAAAGGGPPDYASCVITVDPSTFPAGATLTVTGQGFQPNFETTISFDGAPVGTVTTDAVGAFVTTITAPDDAVPGPHTISAICDDQGNSTSTDVTVSGQEVPTTPGATTPGGGPLPRTGNDIEPLLVLAATALLAGTAFLVIARRRRLTSAA